MDFLDQTAQKAKELFQSISGWKDADDMVPRCDQKIEEINAKIEADRLEAKRQAELIQTQMKNSELMNKVAFIGIAVFFIIVVLTIVYS